LSPFIPNESVEKASFLKSAPSAGSKIGNYHFLSSNFRDAWRNFLSGSISHPNTHIPIRSRKPWTVAMHFK
jgi:hypothetical protein